MTKLKIGFIVDDNVVDHYVFNLIKEVTDNETDFCSPEIIVLERKNPPSNFISKISKLLSSDRPFSDLTSSLLGRLILKLELKKLSSDRLHKDHGKLINTDVLDLQTINVVPKVSKSGFIYTFEEKDLKQIQNNKIDLLIRCGSGILRGEILNCCRFGIISLHHGDNRSYRGIPAGFWEVFQEEASSGFIIQRLTEVLDGGEILLRGNIMTASYWQLNYANLCKKSYSFMHKALINIARSDKLPDFEKNLPYGNKLFRFPRPLILIKYIYKQSFRVLKNNIFSFLNYRVTWSVSYLKHNNLSLSLSKGIEIENPNRRFLADPFLYSHEGRTVCFVEDFFFDENKGKISAYEITDKSHKELGVILEEDFHLSFPYVFKYKGDIFMCPETSEKNEIRLYKCNKFPCSWSFYKTIMEKVSAADTLIFPFNDNWCLLSNICSSHMEEHNSELHMFFAENPLSQNWRPSQNNPIIFDSTKARNGGLFKLNDDFYRVNQIHAKSHYGKAFGINKIQMKEGRDYQEERILDILPVFLKNLIGTHHFHANEEFFVFDHCRLKRLNR